MDDRGSSRRTLRTKTDGMSPRRGQLLVFSLPAGDGDGRHYLIWRAVYGELPTELHETETCPKSGGGGACFIFISWPLVLAIGALTASI